MEAISGAISAAISAVKRERYRERYRERNRERNGSDIGSETGAISGAKRERYRERNRERNGSETGAISGAKRERYRERDGSDIGSKTGNGTEWSYRGKRNGCCRLLSLFSFVYFFFTAGPLNGPHVLSEKMQLEAAVHFRLSWVDHPTRTSKSICTQSGGLVRESFTSQLK